MREKSKKNLNTNEEKNVYPCYNVFGSGDRLVEGKPKWQPSISEPETTAREHGA